MSKNNITILILIVKNKLNRNGLAPLYIRLSYCQQRKSISTGYNIDPLKWDAAKMRVKGVVGN